jgi:hypothetical protein
MGRRGVLALLGGALLVLAGCGPIRWVPETGEVRSFAAYRVEPTTVVVGGAEVAAVTVSVHRCDRLEVAGHASSRPRDLRTVVRISDLDHGRVVYDDPSVGVPPEGTTFLAGSGDVPAVLTVPVGGAGTLRVEVSCVGDAGRWVFAPCTTATRACPRTGDGRFAPA